MARRCGSPSECLDARRCGCFLPRSHGVNIHRRSIQSQEGRRHPRAYCRWRPGTAFRADDQTPRRHGHRDYFDQREGRARQGQWRRPRYIIQGRRHGETGIGADRWAGRGRCFRRCREGHVRQQLCDAQAQRDIGLGRQCIWGRSAYGTFTIGREEPQAAETDCGQLSCHYGRNRALHGRTV
ncbi:unnamed protein product [Mycena citricolor]|uniref:Uncharacterized protein n=1 Tax=Mycena citricolor TaxID=2018698 RepID=A0AAD2JW10_9AGAR|nr:unnamed protein product [Mycena citricolor]